jgi:hypothetical protein
MTASTIARLKIALDDVKPMVQRRVEPRVGNLEASVRSRDTDAAQWPSATSLKPD